MDTGVGANSGDGESSWGRSGCVTLAEGSWGTTETTDSASSSGGLAGGHTSTGASRGSGPRSGPPVETSSRSQVSGLGLSRRRQLRENAQGAHAGGQLDRGSSCVHGGGVGRSMSEVRKGGGEDSLADLGLPKLVVGRKLEAGSAGDHELRLRRIKKSRCHRVSSISEVCEGVSPARFCPSPQWTFADTSAPVVVAVELFYQKSA